MHSLSFLCTVTAFAQTNRVFYAGGTGEQVFRDVAKIENGHYLVSGYCNNLDWIPSDVPLTEIPGNAVANAQGSGTRYGFIARLDSLFELLHVVHLPQGATEDIRHMKFTNVPGEATGELYISGQTEDTKANGGGYFIGKLNNNFTDGIPTALEWVHNVWAESRVRDNQPRDVGSDGKVIYSRGQYQAYDRAAVHRLDANGHREVVENRRLHWGESEDGGFEWHNTPASAFDQPGNLLFSGIVFKRWGRCDLRSWTTEEYYLGFTAKSVLPDDNPDFEPAVVAMDNTGALKWWSRLYHEVTPAGETVNSSPDQYIDAPAVDYFITEIKGKEKSGRLTMYDLGGRLLKEGNVQGSLHTDTGDLTPGIYLLRITTESRTRTIKLMINR